MDYWTSPRDDSKTSVHKWRLSAYLPQDSGMLEALQSLRKRFARERDEMIGLQKECGARGDRDGARFFKEEASDRLKLYRAACLIIPYFDVAPSGDCPVRDMWGWPPELFPALNMIEALATCEAS